VVAFDFHDLSIVGNSLFNRGFLRKNVASSLRSELNGKEEKFGFSLGVAVGIAVSKAGK
jgi:hypothetical protein